MNASRPLLEVKGLQKWFPLSRGFLQSSRFVRAVNNVDLIMRKGETVGIVGESGCGKSTLGRCILRLIEPTDGEIWFNGTNVSSLSKQAMHKYRRNMQMIFQNPYDTLNPKHRIRKILSEPLIAHRVPKEEHETLMVNILERVGLRKEHLERFPHEFSGGQRQRICIARALILGPELVIADEAVSALDVSIQSQILNLLQDLQEQMGLTYLFISHDLSVVQHISDRVAVMYLGEIVEMGDKQSFFQKPLHPYSQALLSAVPKNDPDENRERIILQGDLPSPTNPPSGCKFHQRCHVAMEKCKTEAPLLKEVEGRQVACHLYA
ncbi:dipeptide ABC transporter ATP-binding protein [Brevibacillus invocatus]|uniref:Dipeptide ABC transporter ATP-binding protein n=1 Tax=Brevibacillus invocatus TaxID=173959 RepID=A0A3M8BXF3_9BACL|nr:dipeptide ABC transporter ATP-binding protein [Brevibacillus invocatus]RNB68013.1 dipeptide ABC transporter ATP-binding protein [Brevibacillus invocatus]